MTWLMFALLVLAALSLGLRTTSVLIHPTTQSPRRGGPGVSPRVHPLIRLLLSLLVGGIMTLAILELCRGYHVFELGLGLLASLSPVGMFDVAKWWFTWAAESQGRRRRR